MSQYVYGATCAWHGPITKTKRLPSRSGGPGVPGIPCCPHCNGVLFETEEDDWWKDAGEYEKSGHAGYLAFLRWMTEQDHCWPNIAYAHIEYKEKTNNEVKELTDERQGTANAS